MSRVCPAIAVFYVLFSPLAAQEAATKSSGPSATELRDNALAKAKQEDKQVFLIFGSPGCGWCTYFDKYHADETARQVLDQHVVITKIDTAEHAGGEDMYLEYGSQRGVPAFSILSSSGTVLADSGDKGQNVGFPYKPHEVDHYLKAMKTACPNLSSSELELLATRLKDIAPKKQD